MITFIIPCYNEMDNIKIPLTSLLNQTDGNFKAIIVDDGSTDDSLEVIKSIIKDDPRFRVISKSNEGHVKTRKVGISLVDTDYLAFLDGDDGIATNYVEQINTITQKDNSIDLIKFNHIYYGRDGETSYPNNVFNGTLVSGKFDIRSMKEYMLSNWLGFLTNAAYKTDLIRENLKYYCDELTVGEDTPLSISCLLSSKNSYYLDDYLYNYYGRTGSVVHSYNYKAISSRLLSIGLTMAIIRSHGVEMDFFIKSQLENQEREFNLFKEGLNGN